MAQDINSVTIIGRLTKDAELKYTNSGFAISVLSLAVNSSVKKNDEWIEEAHFFDCKLLGRRGEALNQYLQKGTQIAVIGELKQERWEQGGQKRSKVTILANNVQLLGGNKSNNGQTNNVNNQQYQKPQGNNNGGGLDINDPNHPDFIPF